MAFRLYLGNVVAGGSSVALSGASSITFTPAANLVGDAALSAASSLTFTTAGVLKGDAALSGASSLTFAPSASLVGDASLSGSAALTFAPAADLFVSAALSGVVALAFGASGSLVGDAGLSGSSSLDFSVTGDLTAPSVEEVQTGGGWLSEEHVRRHRQHDEKRRKKLKALDDTIAQAYEDVVHPEIRLAKIAAGQEMDDEEALITMIMHNARRILEDA